MWKCLLFTINTPVRWLLHFSLWLVTLRALVHPCLLAVPVHSLHILHAVPGGEGGANGIQSAPVVSSARPFHTGLEGGGCSLLDYTNKKREVEKGQLDSHAIKQQSQLEVTLTCLYVDIRSLLGCTRIDEHAASRLGIVNSGITVAS